MELTHQIRSWHDGILVGIGTALADNPRLTARLSHGNGHQPRPIVLDSQLRIPSGLRLFDHPMKPIIAATNHSNGLAARRINGSADILKLPATNAGQVSIEPLLESLGNRGVKSLMVEGGGRVLTSFLNSGCINKIIITIAPVFAGGYDAVQPLREKRWAELPRLENMQSLTCGSDLIVAGDFKD